GNPGGNPGAVDAEVGRERDACAAKFGVEYGRFERGLRHLVTGDPAATRPDVGRASVCPERRDQPTPEYLLRTPDPFGGIAGLRQRTAFAPTVDSVSAYVHQQHVAGGFGAVGGTP